MRYALQAHPDWQVTNLDKLTYAGRMENLHDVIDHPRHTFVHGDICDAAVAGQGALAPAVGAVQARDGAVHEQDDR
jgi:dTDP-D-glucose 4,6-dehydratase